MTTAKLTPIGDGLGIVLPKEAIERLQGAEGDELKLIATPHGISLQRVDAESATQLEIAARVMQEDESVLRKLAE